MIITLYTTKDNLTFCFTVSKLVNFVLHFTFILLYSDFLLWTPYSGCRCLHRCFPNQCLKDGSLVVTAVNPNSADIGQNKEFSIPLPARQAWDVLVSVLASFTSTLAVMSVSSGCLISFLVLGVWFKVWKILPAPHPATLKPHSDIFGSFSVSK